MRKLFYSLVVCCVSLPCWAAESYLVGDAVYRRMRVEGNANHNLRKVLPKYYEMFAAGFGYRTSADWGFEVGYQQSKKTTKAVDFAANDVLLFSALPSSSKIVVTPKIIGVYLCAVGYHPLTANSEFMGQFGLVFSKINVEANNEAFRASARGGVNFKAAFGFQHKFGEFWAARILLRYESTQSLRFAYRTAGAVHYFKPFYDSWGLSVGLLFRF